MIALYLTLIDEEEQQNKFELLYFKYRNLMYYIAEGVLNNPDKNKRNAEITETDLSVNEYGNEVRFFDTYAREQNTIPINEVAQALEALPYKYSSLLQGEVRW